MFGWLGIWTVAFVLLRRASFQPILGGDPCYVPVEELEDSQDEVEGGSPLEWRMQSELADSIPSGENPAQWVLIPMDRVLRGEQGEGGRGVRSKGVYEDWAGLVQTPVATRDSNSSDQGSIGILNDEKSCPGERKPINISIRIQNIIRNKGGKVCRLRVKNCSNIDDSGNFNFNVLIDEDTASPCVCGPTCPTTTMAAPTCCPSTCPTTKVCCPKSASALESQAVFKSSTLSKSSNDAQLKKWLDSLVLKCVNKSTDSKTPDVYEINVLDPLLKQQGIKLQDQDLRPGDKVKTIDLYISKVDNGSSASQQVDSKQANKVETSYRDPADDPRFIVDHTFPQGQQVGEGGGVEAEGKEQESGDGGAGGGGGGGGSGGGAEGLSEGALLHYLTEVMRKLSFNSTQAELGGAREAVAPAPAAARFVAPLAAAGGGGGGVGESFSSAKLLVYPAGPAEMERSPPGFVHLRRL